MSDKKYYNLNKSKISGFDDKKRKYNEPIHYGTYKHVKTSLKQLILGENFRRNIFLRAKGFKILKLKTTWGLIHILTHKPTSK